MFQKLGWIFRKTSFFLFLISLPLQTRLLIYQFTSGFHEYESIFIYASDIFLVLFLISAIKEVRLPLRKSGFLLILFLFFAAVSIFFAFSKSLAVYNFVRLGLLVLTALSVSQFVQKKIIRLDHIFAVIAGLAVIESLIGFLQFMFQKSLGLWFLGESVLGPDVGGAAKILVGGARILRAYGTFPHPNIMAAFLLLGLFSLYYFYSRKHENTRKREMIVVAIGIFVVLLGLALTFSRAGWLIGILMSLAFICYLSSFKFYRSQAIKLLIIFIVCLSLIIAGFSSFIFPRAQISLKEPAVVQRLNYNELGVYLIKNNLFGVGIGNQVLYSVMNQIYQKFGMVKVWQWEPIHNFYLLMASEVGIIGLLSFLVFLSLLFLNPKFKARNSKQYLNSNAQNSKLFRKFGFYILNLFRISNLEFSISAIMLLSSLLFGFFDHFLWTIQSGRLMLWLVLGLIIGAQNAKT